MRRESPALITKIFREADGLPNDFVQSLFQDHLGRIWAFTAQGLAYFSGGRFVAASSIPSGEAYSMTGQHGGVLHFKDGRVRASYTTGDASGQGVVASLQSDRDGALWAATEEAGSAELRTGASPHSQPGMVKATN